MEAEKFYRYPNDNNNNKFTVNYVENYYFKHFL